jgi:predicted nuclease of predicted toxin-antitoxin system
LKLFIDECLSPQVARRLAEAGYVAVHPRDYGRRGELDHEVLQRCLDEDLTIVTENANDFRKLIGKVDLHPGLIALPSVGRERSWELMLAAIAFLEDQGQPADLMVNHVLEVDEAAQCILYELPKAE